METQKIQINRLVVEAQIRQRDQLNHEYIKELVAEITDGAKLPPLVVFNNGKDLMLTDGLWTASKYLYH
jgi:hypothetical protein